MNDQTVFSATEYSIIEMVGEGTTGSVYKALKRDRAGHFEEVVAIKAFHKSTNIDGWRSEYKSLVKIQSQYCVRVHSFEWIFDGPAITMDFVDGLALSELIVLPGVDHALVLEVISQTFHGLQDLWDAGLYHGDLSPKNIMIDKSGRIKLLDFGLGNYQAEVKYGTPFFTHPDIMKGEAPSQKMDTYALGQVLKWVSQKLSPPSTELLVLGKAIVDAPCGEPSSFKNFKSIGQSRHRMGRIVSDRLREKDRQKTEQTQEFIIKSQAIDYNSVKPSSEGQAKAPKKWRALVVGTLFSIVVVGLVYMTRPFRPKQDIAKQRKSILRVRTQQWKQIWFDGKQMGYTPTDIKEIEPGKHSLKWVSSTGSGEMVLHLKPGEDRLLTDDQFSNQSQ